MQSQAEASEKFPDCGSESKIVFGGIREQLKMSTAKRRINVFIGLNQIRVNFESKLKKEIEEKRPGSPAQNHFGSNST
jgi:hypothetical protein